MPAAVLMVATTALAAAGCATTQQKAAWLRLSDARLRAAQVATQVGRTSTNVVATGITVLRQGTATAIVVRLRNRGSRPTSDLPISLGYRRGGHVVSLNGAAGGSYFDSHVPLLRAGASLTWVLDAGRRIPARAKPFARIGATPSVAVGGLAHAPEITARVAGSARAGVAAVIVRNHSGVIQYGLPLYAVAATGGRTVAAGVETVGELGGGARQTVRIRVLGASGDAQLTVEAVPTIFN